MKFLIPDKMELIIFRIIFLILFMLSGSLHAQKTEIHFLSGPGCDQPVRWQFFCTSGMNSGKWTTIPVPSCWELQGFGTYNYGHDKDTVRGKEAGHYRYRFTVPRFWEGKEVDIVFDGSMTDTKVKINGKPAGPVHQGAFYRFRYDIGKLLKVGGTNLLDVTVSKHSADESVNRAERHGDYWIFGGIFRPVYLEAKPRSHISRTSVDARADGQIEADVYVENMDREGELVLQAYTLDGHQTGSPLRTKVGKDSTIVRLSGKMAGIRPWNPEDPNLYRLVFELVSAGEVLHETAVRTGFRTVEKRDRDGLYVNGVKVRFKGVNRHTFRPETGRASCRAFSMEDVRLMKEMNMNAVRMSHYPPDSHFLDVCDSLGLFVINELAGWHNSYDTETGSLLVREMLLRDVNHPSVVIWSNGNEGGHNVDLDPLFAEFDIQKRPVIHPWQNFNGITTEHYINYDYGMSTYWHGHDIVLPTEFLHGLYDGGAGAGLADFWELIWNNPRAAGGFLWAFADEGVVRTDRNGMIDTNGGSAPDGILGPFHEKEGSFYAIREIWSPVRLEEKEITAAFDGILNLENRYLYTNTNQCAFTWKLAGMPGPGLTAIPVSKTGKAHSPDIAPGQKGELKLNLPAGWQNFDVLFVTATDKNGMELYTWSRPITLPAEMAARIAGENGASPVTYSVNDSSVVVRAGDLMLTLGSNDGLLKGVVTGRGEIPFHNGPVLSGGKTIFSRMLVSLEGEAFVAKCFYAKESRMKEMTWTVFPSGWVRLDIMYNPPEYDVHFDYTGVDFSFPEDQIMSVKWMGNGPYRVWKNRLQGVELGIHEKEYNKTMTGNPPLVYPEFKGYHSNLYWAEFKTRGLPFWVATGSEDIYLRLFTPDQPGAVYNTAPPFPGGDISFMHGIPPIGTKSQQTWRLGPSGQKNMYFDYGPYDKWQDRCLKMNLFFNFTIPD